MLLCKYREKNPVCMYVQYFNLPIHSSRDQVTVAPDILPFVLAPRP